MKIHAVLVACAVLLASAVASAAPVVTLLGTTGGNPSALAIGETVTLQLTFTNPQGDSINGLGISVRGYDEAVADFQSGTAVSSYLNSICVAPGSCFGGLDNLAGPTLAESAIGGAGNRVQIGLSAALTAVTNVGAGTDQGLDNMVGTSQFDVTFVGVGNGSTTLTIGTGYPGDVIIAPGGAESQATNATLTITVPEPGALAASAVALGSVLGLAGIRRRL